MGDTETFATVKENGPLMDCAGPTRKYTYEVRTEALAKGQRYILGNPSVMQPVAN